MKWRLVGLVLVAVLSLSACTRSGLQAGEGRLVFDNARVQVSTDGGSFRPVGDDVTLHRGDRVRLTGGEARLRLPHNTNLLLRSGTQLRIDRDPVLLGGDVVALPGDRPLTLHVLESRVVAQSGAVRVRSGLGVTAGVYRGSARLVTAGRSTSVPVYRQGTIVAYGVMPDRPSPLRYDDDDRWDRRYLGPAIELTADLQPRSEGFTRQLAPGEGRTLGFYRLLLPQLERERGLASCLADLSRPQGETLVGTSIALEASRGTFAERCRDAFAFRDEGATWGLVALAQGVDKVAGISQVLADAVGRLPASATFAAVPFTAPPPEAGGAEAAAGTAPSDEASSPPNAGPAPTATGPAEGGQPSGAPTVPGVPSNPVTPGPPQPGLLEPVLDPVVPTLDGLLGALLP